MAKKKKGSRFSIKLRMDTVSTVDLDQAETSANFDHGKIDSDLDCDAMGTSLGSENMGGDPDCDETDINPNRDRMSVHSNYDKMSANLDNTAMQQLQAEQRVLLDNINELRRLGLGKNVGLPRVIVVGDRSAGKSSVLEAISRVRFPIKDGLCTRFATELALRPDPQPTIAVRVQSYFGLDTFKRSGFESSDLPRVVEEAKVHMDVTGNSTGFSEDVLHIEIAGPDVPQLTLVDLPGFFPDEAGNQDLRGEEIVNRLAEKYMSQENNIILAVISAKKGLAAQKVLDEAKKHDPGLDRTLGIFTKPDEAEEQSNNGRAYSRLIQLGWHVLRNRAQEEAHLTDAERDKKENKFLGGGVWATVGYQNRGIDALREKLSQLLLTHIQQKLPGLITNIEEHIKSCQTRLERLGDHRLSTNDMKRYLISISNRLQRVARDAIQGNYTDNFFGGLYPDPQTSYEDRRVKKLRALVRDLNRAFHFVLTTKGGRRQIRWGGETPQEVPHHLEPLISLYTLGEHIEISIHDLAHEIDKMAAENQGVEFPGSSNGRVALALFRDQSSSWEAIASQHVNLVSHFSRGFVEQLVGHVAGADLKTADAVIRHIVAPYFEEKQVALQSKVLELLRHYKSGSDPQPMYYEDFLDSMEQQRQEQRAKRVSQLMEKDPELLKAKVGSDHTAMALKVLEVTSGSVSESNAEQTVDNAMKYYETSLKIFADNVVTLALENCLISDIPNILSPEMVYDMTDDKITMLAAESKETKREREELQIQLDKLRKGLAACREHRPRYSSGIIATLPAFSIADPESLLPERTKPGTSILAQPNPQASGQTSFSSGSMDGQGPTSQEADQWNAFRPVTATTQSTSGEIKQSVPPGGPFATAPPSSLTSTGISSASETPNSGNSIDSSSLPKPNNPGWTLFGPPHTGITAQNPSADTKKTDPSSGGTSLFGQMAGTTTGGTSLFAQKPGAAAGGTWLFPQKTVTTTGVASLVPVEKPATTVIRSFTPK